MTQLTCYDYLCIMIIFSNLIATHNTNHSVTNHISYTAHHIFRSRHIFRSTTLHVIKRENKFVLVLANSLTRIIIFLFGAISA